MTGVQTCALPISEDLSLPHWAGLVPLRKGYDAPVADPGLDAGTPLPGYLTTL